MPDAPKGQTLEPSIHDRSLVTRENPNGYWCRKCGRSRAYAEQHCSSAYCHERMRAEDDERDNPRPDYMMARFNLFEGPR